MIQRAEFGRTGHLSSRVLFGAAALGRMGQERTDELLPILLAFGVNHLDTAASYGDSELRLAPWMAAHRDEFFLATKTGDRTGEGARASLERSLDRLGVDAVDLVQLHNLVEPDEWEVAHGRGGAVEARARARDEGLVKFIGVTGHGTRIARMHMRSLDRFDFDSVLVPYNFLLLQDQTYRTELASLLERCEERRVAVQAIKSVARRRWSEGSSEHAGPRFSWYEPLAEPQAVDRGVRYVLSHPQLFLSSPSDARLLTLVLEAADRCSDGGVARAEAPTDSEMRSDVETYDMRPLFDGAELERI
ncbi:MAG: aldo/keto reductase [Acidimicrobiales bacterium]